MPDDSNVYLRIAQIYRELHQLTKRKTTWSRRAVRAGQPGVMYNEAMLYQAQGRFRRRDSRIVDATTASGATGGAAVTAEVAGDPVSATWGNCIATRKIIKQRFSRTKSGTLGRGRRPARAMMIMDTYRAAKDLPKAVAAGKEALAKTGRIHRYGEPCAVLGEAGRQRRRQDLAGTAPRAMKRIERFI